MTRVFQKLCSAVQEYGSGQVYLVQYHATCVWKLSYTHFFWSNECETFILSEQKLIVVIFAHFVFQNEARHRQEEARHANMGKPAEVVRNQYYSSEDYEKFQKELQKKQGEEYRDFLSKVRQSAVCLVWWNSEKTACWGSCISLYSQIFFFSCVFYFFVVYVLTRFVL